MRNARVLLVATAFLAGAAAASTFEIPFTMTAKATGLNAPIDLDVPGALEALEREKPASYAIVMKEVERRSKLPALDEKAGVRNAFLDSSHTGSGRFMLTHPAKRHIEVVAENVAYKISVYFTDDPARIHKAR